MIADPYPAYRALLDGGSPVHYSAKRGIWVISRYDDVAAAARAHDELSSAENIMRQRSRLPMMLTVDRPDHERLRRMTARDFAPAVLAGWGEEITEMAGDLVGRMVRRQDCDTVAELAGPLPLMVIARLLGVPPEDRADFQRWSNDAVDGFSLRLHPRSIGTAGRVFRGAFALNAYFQQQFRRLEASPGDDILSRLLANSEGGKLSDEELFWFVLLLLIAGHETTTSLLGTILQAFALHSDQYAQVRDDPELIPAAVEECLRWVAPIQGYYRSVLHDYQVGPVTIPAGARVLLLFAAANRDPRHYPDPDHFDITRNPTDHLAFGSGIHFCLGAHLARMEGVAVLTQLVDRVRRIELTGPVAWRSNAALRGIAQLPIRLTSASVVSGDG